MAEQALQQLTHTSLERPRLHLVATPQITPEEFQLLTLASNGGIAQADMLLGDDKSELEQQVLETYSARSLAQAVHRAIQAGDLTYTQTAEVVPLSKSQRRTITGISRGMTNSEIGKQQQRSSRENGVFMGHLIRRLNALDRNHAMRRGFEIGFFT